MYFATGLSMYAEGTSLSVPLCRSAFRAGHQFPLSYFKTKHARTHTHRQNSVVTWTSSLLLTIRGWNGTSYPIECKSPCELTPNGLSLHALCCVVSHTAAGNSNPGECSCALCANFAASAPLVKASLVPNSTIISWKFLPTFPGLIKRLPLRKRQQQLSEEKVTKSIESLKA